MALIAVLSAALQALSGCAGSGSASDADNDAGGNEDNGSTGPASNGAGFGGDAGGDAGCRVGETRACDLPAGADGGSTKGVQTCTRKGEFSDWGECVAPACQAGETRTCDQPPPPDASADAGVCVPATQTCSRNGDALAWGACSGAVFAEPRGNYVGNKTNGTQDGTEVCCDPGDELVSVVDCGQGKNHYVTQSGNCGIGHEGPNNYGFACAKVTCHSTSLVCPASDAGADAH